MRVTVVAVCAVLGLGAGCGGSPASQKAPGSDATDGGSSNAPSPRPVTVRLDTPPGQCRLYELPVARQEPSWVHVPDGQPVFYEQNPPAAAPHYEMWAQWNAYAAPVPRPYWVHNLQHGGVAILYRPDAPSQVIDALQAAYDAVPPYVNAARGAGTCGARLVIMTPDPELPDTFAVVAYDWMMTGDCVPRPADVVDFVVRRRDAGGESECADGAWPVRMPCRRFLSAVAATWSPIIPDGDPAVYLHSPPTTGPHYADSLTYGVYDQVVPPQRWIGDLQNGGVGILYRPDAPADLVAALKSAYASLEVRHPCSSNLTFMVQDPDLATPFALVSEKTYMTAQCVEDWAVQSFVYSQHSDPSTFNCTDGTWVPPP